MKIAVQADLKWTDQAFALAKEFTTTGVARYGERLRSRDCVFFKIDEETPTFAVWGTKEHVRVNQLEIW